MLDAREREIVVLHFWEEQPQSAIARHLGISKPRVCQIERRALEKLRRYLDAAAGAEQESEQFQFPLNARAA